jgi:hypothetical protein
MPAVVTAFFAEEEWAVAAIDDSPVPAVRGGYRGENGEWTVDVFWFVDSEQLVVHSGVPRPIPDDRLAAVAGYLTFVNFGLPVGNFELSPLTGDVRFKTGIAAAEGDLTEDLVARQVYANVMITDRYLPGIVQVVWGTDPADAYAAIDG